MIDRTPRVDVLLARAVDEQLHEQRSWREALHSMEDRLEELEDTVAGLTSRLNRWSDPSEIAEEVSGLEEEISVALGRFHKRLESVAESVEANLRSVLEAQIGDLASELRAMRAAFEEMTQELERVPTLLAAHRAALADELKKPVRSARRRARRGDDEFEQVGATGGADRGPAPAAPHGNGSPRTGGSTAARGGAGGDAIPLRRRPSTT